MRRKYEIDDKGEVYGKNILKPKSKSIRAPMENREESTKCLTNMSQINQSEYITLDMPTQVIYTFMIIFYKFIYTQLIYFIILFIPF